MQDYFTPYNQSELNGRDDDLGAGGPVLLPDHFIVVEGKSGVLYLIDRRHMGGFHAGSDNVGAKRAQGFHVRKWQTQRRPRALRFLEIRTG